MIELLAFLLILISVLFLIDLIVSIPTWNFILELRRTRKIEQTRSKFAELRNRLFELMLEDKIDSRSALFLDSYKFLTYALRRPENHPQITAWCLDTMMNWSPNSKETNADFDLTNKSEEVRTLFRDIVDAISFSALQFSPLLRAVVKIDRTLFRYPASRAEEHLTNILLVTSTLRKQRQELINLKRVSEEKTGMSQRFQLA
jgi:hypothetical protein